MKTLHIFMDRTWCHPHLYDRSVRYGSIIRIES